ncbi:hypothetical protein [Actinomadura chokoriensis]|uniref:Uncharacterized protein n=1 Tax=Actinomadura chokoriensis TaxID=454156 RepID=A0ABV4QSM9_9ACTN
MSLRQTGTIPAEQPAEVMDVVVAGAHGGAGTSTLAALLPAAWDMGSIGQLLDLGQAPLQAKGRPVLLAARNTAVAATHATAAIGALHEWGERVTVLAIVSDGGPESRDATARYGLLTARVGGVVRVPHVRTLRLVEDPSTVALPGKAHQALAEIRRLVSEERR